MDLGGVDFCGVSFLAKNAGAPPGRRFAPMDLSFGGLVDPMGSTKPQEDKSIGANLRPGGPPRIFSTFQKYALGTRKNLLDVLPNFMSLYLKKSNRDEIFQKKKKHFQNL